MRTSSNAPRGAAFTLIELLIVISVIAVLSAMLFSVLRAVNQKKLVSRARGELTQVQACIDAYKSKLGYYPPDNRNPVNGQLSPGLNQLYYELAGTIFTNNTYLSKDHTAPALTPPMVSAFFGAGVTGFVNLDHGNSDEGRVALEFVHTLKASQMADITVTNPGTRITVTARLMVCTVPGPDPNSPPLNAGSTFNPWRYNSSFPTNNPTSYDLWADISLGTKVVRICNWSSQPMTVP
jgi:prepilin-type N-terminal cleavage/methylation domain-containing protein